MATMFGIGTLRFDNLTNLLKRIRERGTMVVVVLAYVRVISSRALLIESLVCRSIRI